MKPITIEDLRTKLATECPEKVAEWKEEDETLDATLDRMIRWVNCLWDAAGYKDLTESEFAEVLMDGIDPKSIESILDFINSDEETQINVPQTIVDFYKGK